MSNPKTISLSGSQEAFCLECEANLTVYFASQMKYLSALLIGLFLFGCQDCREYDLRRAEFDALRVGSYYNLPDAAGRRTVERQAENTRKVRFDLYAHNESGCVGGFEDPKYVTIVNDTVVSIWSR